MARPDKMYKDSPELARDEESGKMTVKKSETREEPKARETEGESLPVHARHAHERREMHHRHQLEHAIHDNGKGGSKKDMHERHREEMAAMHKRHDKELGKK